MESVHPLKVFRNSQEPPLSQAGLARLLGVARPTVNRWESGERQIDVELVPQVSAKTGIHPRRLRPDLAETFETAQ